MILTVAIFLVCGVANVISNDCLDDITSVDAEHFIMILTRFEKLETVVSNHPLEMATLRKDLEKKIEDKLSHLQKNHELILEQQTLQFEKQLDDVKEEITRETAKHLRLLKPQTRTFKRQLVDELKELNDIHRRSKSKKR